MPGLMRGMARTAAIVGTATATRNAVNRRQANKNAQAYAQATQIADLQAWCSDLTNRCTQMEDKYARLIRETRSRRTD